MTGRVTAFLQPLKFTNNGKEVKTIGQEVTKAVETMKEAQESRENSPNSNRRKRKSQDTPKSKGKPQEGRGCQIAGVEINRKTKELEKCLGLSWNGRKKFPVTVPAFINAMDKAG
ncbi:hypothetical protein NXV89_22630 [Bacteroides uniformis]|nr:hypothetical protein [Bacteroides uniformis]